MNLMIAGAHEINDWAEDNYYGRISDADFRVKLFNKARDDGTVIWLVSSVLKSVYMIADPDNKSEEDVEFLSESTMEILALTEQGNAVKQISGSNKSFKGAMMSVAIPLVVGNTSIGAIIVHKEMQDVSVGISAIFRQVFFPLVISVAFAAALVFILSRHIIRPIKDISFGAMELARGNLDWRVKLTTRDEIGELAAAFNKMAEELKLQDGLRNTFIANVSHELRTPLSSVQGFIQGMLDRAIEEQDRDKYLEIVLGETKRMSTLITDLLSLAKIESGKFPIEYSEFDINELLRRCLLMFEQRIEEKNIGVSIGLSEEKLIVWADEDRISQVITNLIDNAVKFTGEGGELKVWTYCSENKVHVNISDTGAGIPAEDQPYVFERFFKVDKSHSQGTPGTGIGLSIVKRIIAQHGESISLQSAEGKGTTFTFTLTRAISQPEHKGRTK
jgi:signal transduction histidine kinase